MLVGRTRWVSVVSLGASGGAIVLLSMAACGGRTSAIDPDIYAPNAGDTGGTSGTGTAGKPTSIGGSSGTGSVIGNGGKAPIAGQASGGANAVDPSLAISPCQAYCPGYGTQCSERLNGQDCFTACQNELNSYGKRCQTLGISAIKCLTPFFTPYAPGCDVAVSQALAKCQKAAAAFDKCKNPGKKPTPIPPTPTPDPDPPTPNPPVDISQCSSFGEGDAYSCKYGFQCADGVYTTTCTAAGQFASSCVCYLPNGRAINYMEPVDTFKGCYYAAQSCNGAR